MFFLTHALSLSVSVGTPEQQSEVEQRCVMSEPNRGEKWNAIAKLPEHWKAKPDAILKLVAQTMEPL